jgi:hypothetical protein
MRDIDLQLNIFTGDVDIISPTQKGVKYCNTCKKDLPVEKFGYWWSASYGKEKRNGSCKECVKKNNDIIKILKNEAPPKPELCDCCGIGIEELKRRGDNREYGGFQLDHDHKTGKFRGWICHNCNQGIGKLGDDLEGICRAALYLSGNNVNKVIEIFKKLNNDCTTN